MNRLRIPKATARAAGFAGLTMVLTLLLTGCGGNPIGPFAGGKLTATEATAPFSTFESIARVDTVFLETRPKDPYSVQTWIISVDNQLYVPTSLIMGDSAEQRTWVQNLEADPRLRVQIDDLVYPMTAERITNAELHRRVMDAFQQKYESELPEIDDHASNSWLFRLNNALPEKSEDQATET